MDAKMTKEMRNRLESVNWHPCGERCTEEHDCDEPACDCDRHTWKCECVVLRFAASESALAVGEYQRGLAGGQPPELADAESWLRGNVAEPNSVGRKSIAIARELDRLRAEVAKLEAAAKG